MVDIAVGGVNNRSGRTGSARTIAVHESVTMTHNRFLKDALEAARSLKVRDNSTVDKDAQNGKPKMVGCKPSSDDDESES